jgi:hypothetical protein
MSGNEELTKVKFRYLDATQRKDHVSYSERYIRGVGECISGLGGAVRGILTDDAYT